MTNDPAPKRTYSFGEFRVETDRGLLTGDGVEVHLAKRPFLVLVYLIENRDRFVGRDELLSEFWDGHDVYDDALRKAVGSIRKALGDLEKPPLFIETRYGGGYRFIGAVADGSELIQAAVSGGSPVSKRFPLVLALIFASCAAAAVALGFYWPDDRPQPRAESQKAAPKRNSIAVLPLRNLTGDPANDYLSDGVTESLINELGRIGELRVISRNSVFEFKNKDAAATEIGQKLGVDMFLEGSFKRSGDLVRIEARLVSTADGSVIWSSALAEKKIDDLFDLQDSIVCQMVNDLKIKVCGEDSSARYTANSKAYQLYLQGLFHRNVTTPEGLKNAEKFFKQALAAEPNFAPAHDGLAQVYMVMEFNSVAPPGSTAKLALEHAQKALELDDGLAGANLVLGAVKTLRTYDLAERERFYRQAILKNPNHRTARLWLSNVLLAKGDFDGAEAEIRAAERLDPLSYGVWISLCELFLYSRRPEKAIEQAEVILATRPGDEVAHLMLAKAHIQLGNIERAAEFLDKSPASVRPTKAIILARDLTEARAAIAAFAATEQVRHSPYWVAGAYAYVGDTENAFIWLEKAYSVRQADLVSLKIDPNFDSIRRDDRYRDLLKRISLE